MKQYLDLCQHILNNGVLKPNRTGVDTIGVFGYQLRCNLQDGFPLLTTKKMFLRGIIEELLWFISGSTNIKELQEKNIHIWDAWGNEDGELGPTYGKQLRNIDYSYWMKPMIFEKNEPIIPIKFDTEINIDYSTNNTTFLGKEFNTKTCGKITVIKEIPQYHNRTKFIIKFHNTGYEKQVSYHDLQTLSIKDPYFPLFLGIGCYGEFDEKDSNLKMLMSTWHDILKRCYDKNNKEYNAYGFKGVFVDNNWLIFANFQRDVKKLPNWELKKEYPDNYSIDKDILYASNKYSQKTCMWASHEEQSFNTSTNRPFTVANPNGEKILFRSIGEAHRKYELNISAVHRCLNGELLTHHNWSNFEYEEKDGLVLRTRIIDQLKNTICSIKHNPNSRRHIISLYNPHEIDKMNLPPCHGNIIHFDVTNNKLNCLMYQRSADCLLGIPFNIASYALLTMMIAQVCNLEPGEFIHTFGDLHIYTNHIEQVKLQLTREPRKLPRMIINPEVKDINGFKYEDFKLEGYNPWPSIKGEVAI